MLLLPTPDLFGMNHPQGGWRIDREDDPIRNELLFAQQSGATIVPLLTEGMVMPAATSMPASLRFICEAHALKLRTDDWAHDLQRILVDLRKQGVEAAAQRESLMTRPVQSLVSRLQRWLMYRVYSSDGSDLLDTGNISLSLQADGRELNGQLWSNGDQTATTLRLVRRP